MNRLFPRICIAVQGRFHAFSLAKALIDKGAPVEVLTNYPSFIARRWGLDGAVLNCAPHIGVLHQLTYRYNLISKVPVLEQLVHRAFGRWIAKQVVINPPRILHSFTGVARDGFEALTTMRAPTIKTLTRGSAHIVTQSRLLDEEAKRNETEIETPTPWLIRTEVEEYKLAECIFVLSSFAKNSFIEQGVPAEKLRILSLGVSVGQFHCPAAEAARRIERIRSGKPLRVLYAGTVSYRKGVVDLIEIAKALHSKMHFTVVGNIRPAEQAIMHEAARAGWIELRDRVPETELPAIYWDHDAFILPTIEDGFAVTISQAQAAGLPVLATTNSAAPDVLHEGKDGWVLPIRNPEAFISRLEWCDANRELFAGVASDSGTGNYGRDWSQVADDFLSLVFELIEKTH